MKYRRESPEAWLLRYQANRFRHKGGKMVKCRLCNAVYPVDQEAEHEKTLHSDEPIRGVNYVLDLPYKEANQEILSGITFLGLLELVNGLYFQTPKNALKLWHNAKLLDYTLTKIKFDRIHKKFRRRYF